MSSTFDERLTALRPRLHGLCARMMGSRLDGEDLVQESLAAALANRDRLVDPRALEGWVFRIAHNRCVDALRAHRDVGLEHAPEPWAAPEDPVERRDALTLAIGVLDALAPQERACLILKDVFDYPLAEIAEVVQTSVGAVKSALHRGRGKVASHPHRLPLRHPELVDAYVERFNRRDWDGVRELVVADVRVEVLDRATGTGSGFLDGRYFHTYAGLPPWRLEVRWVDAEAMIVRIVDGQPEGAVRLWAEHGRVGRIRDYAHVAYLLDGLA